MTANTDYRNPPTNWHLGGVVNAGDDIYYRVQPVDNPTIEHVYVWHWCTAHAPGDGPTVDKGRWMAAGVAKHTLVAVAPLHLEPSILWPCCNKHGYIHNGKWESA